MALRVKKDKRKVEGLAKAARLHKEEKVSDGEEQVLYKELITCIFIKVCVLTAN